MRARQWTLAAHPERETTLDDFRLVDAELPPLADGEACVAVDVIGLAPSLRFRMTAGGAGLPGMQLGDPITAASGVGRVIASRRAGIAEGDVVYGDVGWADYANVGAGRYLVPIGRSGEPLTNPRGVLGEVSGFTGGRYEPEDFIGALGGVAMAAAVGLSLVNARAGETIVVTAAAGGVGHLAVQLAQIMGLEVVALSRTASKRAWLRDELGVKQVVDATSADGLAAVPRDYDVLFDNVGGPLLEPLLGRIARNGRVALCGLIDEYESGRRTSLALAALVFRDVTLRGYFADDFLALWGPALDALGRWLHEGRIVRGYDIAHGLDALPATHLRLFRGETNRGKLMVRVTA